jgi:cobyrinic acid a,c-diamide synthase
MVLTAPRLVIAGLSGDSGKTLAALGLTGALRRRGLQVAPYKKGPDYIDAAWLGAAAGRPGRNLDTFLMRPEGLGASLSRSRGTDLVLVEGNRGLHDGMDASGTHSTAELAKRLGAPVVIVVDATKSTRTLAACVRGCAAVEPELVVAGVILNRVGTHRQERVVRDAFAALGAPPVLGALPRLDTGLLPARHLGLVTTAEHDGVRRALDAATDAVDRHVDVAALVRIAGSVTSATFPDAAPLRTGTSRPVKIAVLRDEAFSFYYPENLEALEAAGARLIEVSPLRATALPAVDAVYAGGGFPELHAAGLAANVEFRRSVRKAAADGVPIYAECGGLMFLCRELRFEGESYPMASVLDLVVEQTSRPQGHGYVEARVEAPNPVFAVGTRLRGHEFHYSRPLGAAHGATALHLDRGIGLGASRDAVVAGTVWASYMHLHALGVPEWAPAFVAAAARHHAPADLPTDALTSLRSAT